MPDRPRLKFRCERCSSEFRPVYHYEGDTCPSDGVPPTGYGPGGDEDTGETVPGMGTGDPEGEGSGEGDGDPLTGRETLSERIGKAQRAGTPPPQPTDSPIEDLIVKIARREAGILDDAQTAAIADVVTEITTAAGEALSALRDGYAELDKRIGEGGGGGSITIEVKRPDRPTVTVEGQHAQFPALMKLCAARVNAYIVGPAGSGKTKAAELVAEALGMPFYPKSMGPTTTAYELLGYTDAGGQYVAGLLFKPFTEGGLLLIDEMDNASAAAVTTLNTALANDYCAFPHGVFKKHADFMVIASGNTFGRGADRMYVGRTQLDAATLNRFNTIVWDYDEKFEKRLAVALAESLGEPGVVEWAHYVQQVRKSIAKNGIRAVAGTRDIIEGARTLAAGFTKEEVADQRFFAAMSADEKSRVLAGIA